MLWSIESNWCVHELHVTMILVRRTDGTVQISVKCPQKGEVISPDDVLMMMIMTIMVNNYNYHPDDLWSSSSHQCDALMDEDNDDDNNDNNNEHRGPIAAVLGISPWVLF